MIKVIGMWLNKVKIYQKDEVIVVSRALLCGPDDEVITQVDVSRAMTMGDSLTIEFKVVPL